MRFLEGALVLSATDLTGFLECEHLTELERHAAENGLPRPQRDDPELLLLRSLGADHEAAYRAHLESQGKSLIEISEHGSGLAALAQLEADTVAAMRAGWDYIYQGGFFDGRWSGRADFLRRVEKPSRLGDWSYEVEDAKLARRLKVAALIQTADYSRHVARVQGRIPEQVHVILGNNTVESRSLGDVSAYCEAARQRLEAALRHRGRATYPVPVDHCRVCRWFEGCDARRRGDDHLSLVAGAHQAQIAKLQAAGVHTARALAARTEPVQRLSEAALTRLRTQASLQLNRRRTGVMEYELVGQEQGAHRGLALLPAPCDGDLFFDIEGDPFAGDRGLEYLLGVLERVDGRTPYTSFWGHDARGERAAFEGFIDMVMARLRRAPALHVYHYSSYEPSALKRLAGRYATREDDVDRLLRGAVLVDLYAVVRNAVQASTESYSLKALEPLYMGARTDRIRDAGSSVVEYERWLRTHDSEILDDLARYNEADCLSTLLLREWLEARRPDYAAQFGTELPRPPARDVEPSQESAAFTAETEALARALTASIPESGEVTPAQQAGRLLASMLDWHRREARPEWWAFYARLEMDGEQLHDDPYALAGLHPEGFGTAVGASVVQRYRFDPGQEFRVEAGDSGWIDPATGKSAGEVVLVDRVAGDLELKRGTKAVARGHPGALVPPGPLPTTQMRKALLRVAEWVVAHGVDGPGPYRAARDLLLGCEPRVPGRAAGEALGRPGEAAVDAAQRIALVLDASCLPIQGPPGTGKTYAAAQIALRLVEQSPRRRVGVTALSHRAISQLVSEICAEADRRQNAVCVVQKADAGQACESPMVNRVEQAAEVVAALGREDVDVVAGTAWLFSRDDMEGTLDTLIVDEASQVSLANVIAMSGCARNIILCGDPQQLNQPTRGTHPDGADRSALQHVLRDAHTIAPERGLFLDVTRRMHPDLCRVVSDVFYDGRLTSFAACAEQRIATDMPGLRGSGLRFLPVAHAGNSVKSVAEAAMVRVLVDALLSGSWTDQRGATAPLSGDDVVVLAPYNAQVAEIARELPEQVRVGTVDRFQGQQAAVAIYSMATSSGDDQRRGMNFLYSLNRLDVALSRARAVAVLVCSPDLTSVRCRTAEQLVLANALCRLIGSAGHVTLPAVQHELSLASAQQQTHLARDLEVLARVHDEHRG